MEVRWNADGQVSAAGYWTADTVKKGRWKYYHPDGKVKATEDYTDGKLTAIACFDAEGKPLEPGACEEKEASFPGGTDGWRRFLERNLRADVPVRNNAPIGKYTVVMQFIVAKDGSLEDIKPLTSVGYGMEQEVERILKTGPKWVPAQQYGTKVKAYRRQPITFVVGGR